MDGDPYLDLVLPGYRDFIAARFGSDGILLTDSKTEIFDSLVKKYGEDKYPHLVQALGHFWTKQDRAITNGNPSLDSYPRLRAAFRHLRSEGILAEMAYSCCTSCGLQKMGKDSDSKPTGFVFYSQQTAESIPYLGRAHLVYGGLPSGSEERDLLIGKRVVAVLRSRGIQTNWPETTDYNIEALLPHWSPRSTQSHSSKVDLWEDESPIPTSNHSEKSDNR